jgi:hypothetical protein
LGRRRADRITTFVDGEDLGADRDRGTFFYLKLLDHTCHRGRDLGVYLVGDDFGQRLVLLNGVAGLLEPLADGAFGDALAQLGHGNRGYGHSFSSEFRVWSLEFEV